MKAQFKKVVSNNVFLYYCWFKLVRKRKGLNVDFFQRDTDVYIDAYPRSGNTFLIHLIRKLLPTINAVHHLHVVAPIKIALTFDIPAFIIVRNPMECISSKYLKHHSMRGLEVDENIDNSLVHEFIYDYLTYYDFVNENIDKISIVEFEQLINSPEIVLDKIKRRLNVGSELNTDKISEAVQSYKGATNTMGSSRPNPQKEKYKSLVKEEIVESSKYSDIIGVYESILNQL